jgi:uncharacterized glyoxalase superfamily protein PhnB
VACELLEVRPADSVLEVGFGPGVIIQHLSNLAPAGHVAGVDPSLEMVEQARRRNATGIEAGRIDLRHGSVESLPFDDNRFDKVVAINSMQVWPDALAGLREIGRVMKPGGKIALCFTPYSGSAEGLPQICDAAGLNAKRLIESGKGFCSLATNHERLRLRHKGNCLMGEFHWNFAAHLLRALAKRSSLERPVKGGILRHDASFKPIKESTMTVKPIPDGFHAVTPYLTARGAAKVIEFLKKAFGAETVFEPMKRPDGLIMHAELKIGDSRVMVADANEQCQPTQAQLYLYVPNTDATYQRALAAGATSTMAPADMFYGDRSASVKDSSGNTWFIATHKEDVAPQELAKRAEAFFKQQKGKAA